MGQQFGQRQDAAAAHAAGLGQRQQVRIAGAEGCAWVAYDPAIRTIPPQPSRHRMSPTTRRVLQAVLYEVGAIAFVGPVLGFAFGKPASSTFLLAVVLSAIALCWNYVFNAAFEWWESRQAVKGRSFARRLAHGTGFEGGLTIILVPVMALWLDTTFLAAFLANLGLLVFFFVYAVAFTWAFDKVFGLPQSALGAP